MPGEKYRRVTGTYIPTTTARSSLLGMPERHGRQRSGMTSSPELLQTVNGSLLAVLEGT